jgi:hypothetical protein
MGIYVTNELIRDSLDEIENGLRTAREKGYDLSVHNLEEGSEADGIQDNIRLATRAMYMAHHGDTIWGMEFDLEDHERILTSLESACVAFGSHPFHNVIEGRMSAVVRTAKEKRLPVPKRFERYGRMKEEEWNSPFLNYRVLENIPERAKDAIPPEFR